MPAKFWSRADAGALLARELERYRGEPALVVLALPRGGVPVGFEVARKLGACLDALVVEKLELPGTEAERRPIGAVAGGGVRVLATDRIDALGVPESLVQRIAAESEADLARREHAYRGWSHPLDLRGRTALLVDDGIASGLTMNAAILAAKRQGARRVIVATPVGAESGCRSVAASAEEVICIHTPQPFTAIGACYDQFPQVSDEDVRDLLERTRQAPNGATSYEEFTFAGLQPS
jgi:predicted phosphoribosyltransferase